MENQDGDNLVLFINAGMDFTRVSVRALRPSWMRLTFIRILEDLRDMRQSQ